MHAGRQRNPISRSYFVSADDSHYVVNSHTTKQDLKRSKASGKIFVDTLAGPADGGFQTDVHLTASCGNVPGHPVPRIMKHS